MAKSPEAFRTISEVADWLGVPTHVLRFWESRFSQIKPVKRAGGRRYYRPTDMALIGGIKRLLHDDGMTIRGAQKLLREKGVKHVAALSQPLEGGEVPAAPDVIETVAIEVADTSAKEPKKIEDPADAPLDPVPAGNEQEDAANLFAADESTASEDTSNSEIADPVPAPAPVAIPDTPDVPDTDPDDADTSFPALPSVAAQLHMLDKSVLHQHRDALVSVRERLAATAKA